VTQPAPELDPEDYESWRVLQEVLEEGDREWWAEEADESE
jgi:hypothetical protein